MIKFLPYLFAFTALVSPLSVVAQTDDEEDLVPLLERPEEVIHESNKAVRISVGGTAGVAYNDNIFREENDETGDFIAIFRPGVRVKTDMKPFQIDLRGTLEVGEYFTESENSYIDTDIDGRVSYDVTPETQVYIGGRHRTDHVAIGAFTDAPENQAAEPTDFDYVEVNAGVKVDTPQWVGHLHSGVDFYDYENASRRNGTTIINDDRDRDEYHTTARVGYKIHPDTVLYVEGEVNQRKYDSRVDSTLLFSRDSDGVEVLAGIRIGEKRDKFFGDIGIGYLQQDYDSSVLPTVDGVALRADFRWQPDELWKARAYLGRDVRETTTSATSGYLQTRVGTELSYQWLDDLSVGGKLRYTQNDFEVNQAIGGIPRTDDVYDGSLYADYNFHENYVVGGEYLRISRTSDDSSRDYDSNVFLMRLGVLY